MTENYRKLIDQNIRKMAWHAFRFSLLKPSFAGTVLRIRECQKKAADTRKKREKEGLLVPPFLALSVTHRCNLNCAGCYARALHPKKGEELTRAELKLLLLEASELGVSIVTVLGGEPFYRDDLFDVIGAFPGMLFLVFTNGTLINGEKAGKIKKYGNVVPVLSIEGFKTDTDNRRGKGVYSSVSGAAGLFRRHGVFFGASITASRNNYANVTDRAFIDALYRQGCRLFFYIEYLPARPGTENLCLSGWQKEELTAFVNRMRNRYPALFLDFPGDEYAFGGCLSAGRGFIHVSPEGNYEPCPFSPYSDANVRTHSLRQALQSKLFESIRAMPDNMAETGGNCALWENRARVEGLAKRA